MNEGTSVAIVYSGTLVAMQRSGTVMVLPRKYEDLSFGFESGGNSAFYGVRCHKTAVCSLTGQPRNLLQDFLAFCRSMASVFRWTIFLLDVLKLFVVLTRPTVHQVAATLRPSLFLDLKWNFNFLWDSISYHWFMVMFWYQIILDFYHILKSILDKRHVNEKKN